MIEKILVIIFILTALPICAGETKTKISEDQMMELVIDENQEIREAILSNSQRFLSLASALLSQPEELFYLADKSHALTREQAPKETVSPFDYGISVTKKERVISSLVIDDLKKMCEAAAKEGLDIVFASGYRPFDYQEMLFNRYVEEMGLEAAEKISARPGTSQHQLGTAIDFGSIDDSFALEPEGIWLLEHGWEYGFSLSYPKGALEITGYDWECWHYRYLGREALEMEREFFGLQQNMMEFWNRKSEYLRKILIN